MIKIHDTTRVEIQTCETFVGSAVPKQVSSDLQQASCRSALGVMAASQNHLFMAAKRALLW